MPRPITITPSEAAEELGISPSHLRKIRGIPGEFRTKGRQRRFRKNRAFILYAQRKRQERNSSRERTREKWEKYRRSESAPHLVMATIGSHQLTSIGIKWGPNPTEEEISHIAATQSIMNSLTFNADAKTFLIACAIKSRWHARDIRRFVALNPWIAAQDYSLGRIPQNASA